MNIEYIGDRDGKVHVLKSNGFTACGENTRDNREDWKTTYKPVTCQKRGCK